MAYQVKVTARAARDLKGIFQRINALYSPQAHAWFDGLESAVFSLTDYPERGKPTSESKELRELHYGNPPHIYRIIYRVDERAKQVTVLHIRHRARQAADDELESKK
jgi:addiction module RelE/StbE family toxin